MVGHENIHVRSSTAAAIADGVEHHPSTIQKTVLVLQDLYREKVRGAASVNFFILFSSQAKILAPEFDEYVCSTSLIQGFILT
jgi:hypothetical protein